MRVSLMTKKNPVAITKYRGGSHAGQGFTTGGTARDNWNDIPAPLLRPLVSVGYGSATFQMSDIPGAYNKGNVYFAWMWFQF